MIRLIIPGEKVTKIDVVAAVKKKTFQKLGKKIMVCHLELMNGHEVIGMAGVVNPDLFDQEIGEAVSYENAQREVWKHLGGLLQNQNAAKLELKEPSDNEKYTTMLRTMFEKGDYKGLQLEVRTPQIKDFLIGLVMNGPNGPMLSLQYIDERGKTIRNKY